METHTAQELLARNVRRVRELQDRSQSWLADQLGWSKQTLSKLENGDRGITVDDLLALAMALDVAPAALLVPWEDDERLRVDLPGRSPAVDFDSEDGFGWIIGAPGPELVVFANQATYFGTTPAAVQRRYGRRWLDELRTERGWEVADDGTYVNTGGLAIDRGEEEE